MERNKRNHEFADESYPMNGGDGPFSYVQNSNYQRGVVEASKELIKESIIKTFDTKTLIRASPNHQISIADLGCSTGPNTFLAVENIIDSIQLKHKLQSHNDHQNIPEPTFQVMFNDLLTSDFNTLFKYLPRNRDYFACGVPGSFHSTVFPRSSLHFAHCSYSLHWLSRVPEGARDRGSPAWNKGRIHYGSAGEPVVKAYADQYARDMASFFEARARELVVGGLVALLVPAVPEVLLPSDATNCTEKDLLGSCLVDMGLVSEEKVDSFNLPMYYTSPSELKAIIERNEQFSIESLKILNNPKKHVKLPNVETRVLYVRAALEGLLRSHFGADIMDELFQRFSKKLGHSSFFLDPQNQKSIVLFVLLKRKPNYWT